MNVYALDEDCPSGADSKTEANTHDSGLFITSFTLFIAELFSRGEWHA